MIAACLDIETYGAFERVDGKPMPHQKQGRLDAVMHPERTRFWHPDVDEPVSLVSMTSLPHYTGNPREWLCGLQPGDTTVYKVEHWPLLLRRIEDVQVVMGFNLMYDLSYLRHRFPLLKSWRPLVIDVSVLAYLEDENRIEMSLKDLGVGHGLFAYERTLKDGRFSDPDDPLAVQYAAEDTHNTALLAAALANSTVGWYGSTSYKLSETCIQWYSETFWTVLAMYEAGFCIDRGKAIDLMESLEAEMASIATLANTQGISLEGNGCRKNQAEFVERLLAEHPAILDDDQLHVQEKAGGISLMHLTNLMVFTKHAPQHAALFEGLARWIYLRQALWGKLHKRLVYAPKAEKRGVIDRSEVAIPLEPNDLPRAWGKGYDEAWRSQRGVGRLTPKWYLCPGRLDDADDATLGQRQVRPSCGGPGLQTDPQELHDLACSRYPGGIIVKRDASQIELRVAAVWSGEWVDEFNKSKPDLHTRRAIEMFGPDLIQQHIGPVTGDHAEPATWRSNPAFNRFRQVGKTGNFWYVYRGGAKAMHEQTYAALGIDLGLPLFQRMEAERTNTVPKLWAWQESLLDRAQVDGFIEIPWIGASRTYWGNVRREHATTVVNQMVQSCGAATILSLMNGLRKRLPSGIHMVLQVYDSIVFDCHPDVAHMLDDILLECVANCEFWNRLCDHTGHRVPLIME